VGQKEYLSLDYDEVIHETEKAYLLAFGDLQQWLPKSVVDPEFMPLDEDGGEVAVEAWFIHKQELEDYLS